MPIVEIDNPADPRVAEYLNVREADLVGRRGLFIAEGPLVVRRLIERSPFRCRSMLLSRKRLEAMEGEIAMLARRNPSAPVFVAAQGVMDAIAGFPIHRGALAVGERGETLTLETALSRPLTPRVIVGLEGVANHDNVGGAFRNAAALGAGLVALDARTCDPLYRKAIRVSIGCALTTPFARVPQWPGEGGGLALLRAAGVATIALTPGVDAIELERALERVGPAKPVAILLGEEGRGLRNATLAQADARARIDMRRGADSLNVATAGAIALYALQRLRASGDPQ